jgi:CelD/BcsL family acetyltransferase involved in cellulose biosynthesis
MSNELINNTNGPTAAIRISLCSDRTELLGLRHEWDALHELSDAGFFASWAWMSSALSQIHPERAPKIFLARDDTGTLVGVLPLSEERVGSARVWRFLGDDTIGSDYLDVMAVRGHEGVLHRALWAEVIRRAGADYDLLDLLDLVEGTPSVGVLRALCTEARLPLRVHTRFRCPHIAIEGTFEAHLKNCGRADNLKRRRRWLEKQPGYTIEVATRPDGVDEALDSFFRLHRLRWASDGGSQGINSPKVEAFHRQVTRLLAERHQVRLYTLRVEGRAIASVYMLVRGKTWSFYQSGYDPAWAPRSPGLVLLARTIEDAFVAGASEYDFLRGEEPYKFEWATGERRTLSLRLVGPTLSGRWLEAEQAAGRWARGWAKRLLPDLVVEAWRRHRRVQGWSSGVR